MSMLVCIFICDYAFIYKICLYTVYEAINRQSSQEGWAREGSGVQAIGNTGWDSQGERGPPRRMQSVGEGTTHAAMGFILCQPPNQKIKLDSL